MSTEKKEVPSTKPISASELKVLINDKRFKYADIAQHYGIPVAAAKRAVKEAGFTMRRFKTAKFVIVHDLPADGTVSAEAVENLKDIPTVAEEEVVENTNLTAKEEVTEQVAELQPETAQVTEEAPVTNVEETVAETAEATQETTATEQVTEEAKEEVTKLANEETYTTEEDTTEEVPLVKEETTTNAEATTEDTEGFSNKPAEATDDEW